MLRSKLARIARTQSRGLSVPSAPFLAKPKTCSVIGAPVNLGQPLLGVEQGPNSIRQAGLRKRIIDEGWRFLDQGDLKFPPVLHQSDHPNLKNAEELGVANRLLYEAVYKDAVAGNFVLTLGGDHSVAIGSIAGILRARPNCGIIWVDAHGDINTTETSHSGNIHGMSASFLMDHIKLDDVPSFHWLQKLHREHGRPLLAPQDIVYVGLRDLDAGEKTRLRSMGIKAFSMQQVDKYGIGKVMEMALDHLCSKQPHRPLHLSVDIDSVDPTFAPGTGTTVRGGLTDREAYYICEAVAESSLLGSMDLVEVNPALSPGDIATADMAARMIGGAMGNTIL